MFLASACGSSGAGRAAGTGGSAGGTGGSASGGAGGTGATGGSQSGGADAAIDSQGSGATGGTQGVWRPFNDSSPWNTVIPADAAIDPNSATMIADFATMTGQPQFWVNFSNPIYYVDSTTTPMVMVMAGLGGTGFRMGAANDSVGPGNGPAPIPVGAMPISGGDQHLGIVDRVVGMEWGFFAAMDTSSGWMASVAATLDLTGTGVRPPERDNPWWAGHGPRACGFGEINGLIGADEVRAGAIEHALVIAYPHVMSRYYTPPASTAQGTTTDALPTRGILCGGQIQLDPTLDVTTLGLNPAALAIAHALQKYGAFVGDYSGATALFADASPDAITYWNGVLGNLDAQNIPLNRFRVLQIGMTYDNGN